MTELSTGALLSNYSEVLKTFYLPAIQDQLNHDTILMDRIAMGPQEDVSGKNFTIEMHYGRSTGTGARADAGPLPTASYQKYKTAVVPMKYNYGRVQFTGPTIAATRSERGAYADVIDSEITGIVTDLKKELNRQLWGNGTGVLARWLSGTSTSLTVQKAYKGNAAGGDGWGSTFGAKYLIENSLCEVVVLTTSGSTVTVATLTDTDLTASAVVEGTISDAFTITNVTSSSVAAGTFFVRAGTTATVTAASSTAGAHRREMMGLRGIVTDEDMDTITYYDGTDRGMSALPDPLQGLAVGTYSWWKAIVATSGTRYGGQRALTLKMMDKMFDDVEEVAGKDYGPDMILTTRALRREYLELCRADRRVVNEMSLDGGWTALSFNGVPLTVDNDAIDGEIYFLTLKDIARYRMSDFNWMEKDGSVFSRISGYDAYEAILFIYQELGCRRRNAQGVLCDLSYET